LFDLRSDPILLLRNGKLWFVEMDINLELYMCLPFLHTVLSVDFEMTEDNV